MYDNLNVSMELKNRTEQDNIYETLQHGTGELADKTTPSAKKCTPLLLWCTLVVNSILIGLLIIAVSVSLYMSINVSKASNSKESMKNVSEVVANIKKDVDKSTSGLDDLKTVTDEIKEQMKRLDQATEKKTQIIAFNVANAVYYAGTDAIKFAIIILNEGDAYNNDTGIFTAPIDGIYQFNAHICGNETVEAIDYYIAVNSNWKVTGEFTAPARATDAKCTSFSAVALVRKGENVRVGGMYYSELEEYENDVCSFSGVLIKSI